MDTIQAILTRRSVRNWTEQQVSEEDLTKILEAGRHAPSPLNSQPWHFIVVKQKDTIADLMKCAHHGAFLSHANILIVTMVETKAIVDSWLSKHEQHILSGACAMQNMWLESWELGLGSCWVTLDDTITKNILKIPDTWKIIGCLATGYAKVKSSDYFRHDINEMVSYEKFEDTRKKIYGFTGKIIRIIQETHDVKTFILEKPNNFQYKAGQYCLLSFSDEREINGKRDVPMTISSSPSEKNISFTIKNMGGFTNELFKLKEGDSIEVKGPIGNTIKFDETTKGNFVFLSGGTGIVPFISILRFVVAKGMKNRITMLNANISFEDIIYREELDRLSNTYENIYIMNTLEHPPDGWEGEQGFINKEMIKRRVYNLQEVTWFLCGPPPMFHSLKVALLELGVSEERIKMESYELPAKSQQKNI